MKTVSKQRKISVGVGVIVIDPYAKHMLVTRRLKGSNGGVGSIAMPGGRIEENERAYNCAVRETAEETGLLIRPRLLYGHTYVFHSEERFRQGRHQITLYVVADVIGGQLANLEPHKHEEWKWVSLDNLVYDCTSNDWIPVHALVVNRVTVGL
jgi:8-oxo-dGTP diphosphatase